MPRQASFTNRSGRWVLCGSGSESFRAFVPKPLPPDPPVAIDGARQHLLERAAVALGRLDGIGRLLPGPEELLYSSVRKEAVLSSQIEGTQSSLADLLLHEHDAAPGIPLGDVTQVSNYVAALHHGIKLLEKRPLSLPMLCEVHDVLLGGTRGQDRGAGNFRRIQNWIGGRTPREAIFVPPPANEVAPALDAFEKFLHRENVPTLVKAALAHAQFETIHPFLDGNGRVGRILIPLLLIAEGKLDRPWLYLSLHFKRNRERYYALLQATRTDGAWEPWVDFFLEAVAATADAAVTKIRDLQAMFDSDRARVSGARSGSVFQQAASRTNLDVFDHLRRRMAIAIPATAESLGTTKPTVARALRELVELRIAREATGRERGRVFVYDGYLKILERD